MVYKVNAILTFEANWTRFHGEVGQTTCLTNNFEYLIAKVSSKKDSCLSIKYVLLKLQNVNYPILLYKLFLYELLLRHKHTHKTGHFRHFHFFAISEAFRCPSCLYTIKNSKVPPPIKWIKT